ncbi:protocadherin alpha-8-like [Hypomesus transpacificus]|uniref:protocadherin alpha-8-like n=1 Tax=Hypomesus transpacificus TaxID=137520 RepID=UPI001F08406A|nr:protocadherin alpha-8-like [Hypomesus transpacificus]
MEQRGYGERREQQQWVAFVVALSLLWCGVSAQITYTISEELKEGTVVGNVANDLGLDPSTLKHRGFRIVSSSTNPLFEVNLEDGILYVKQKIDREEVCEKSSVCMINLKTVLENPLEIHDVAVEVLDLNDNSPVFSMSPYTFYITENNEPGTKVFSVSASDRDENENAQISFNIVRDGVEDELSSFLNVNSENGEILALKSFDFETNKTFNFQVVATDSGTPSLSSNVTVNVFILDQNDAPVILYPVSTNGSAEGVEEIPNNVNAGHLVTKVRAFDADIGYNGWLLFSLQEVSDYSLFGLDRYTGEIRTLRSFTETDEAEYKLVILVKDHGNVSLSATATVIINAVEPKEAFAASYVKSSVKDDDEDNDTFYLIITLGSVSTLFLVILIVLIVMQCSKTPDAGGQRRGATTQCQRVMQQQFCPPPPQINK